MRLATRLLLAGAGAQAATVWFAPAAGLAPWLPPPFQFAYASGTVWKGEALLAGPSPLCPIAWQVSGWRGDSIEIELRADTPCRGQAKLQLSPQRVALSKLDLALSANMLAHAAAALKTWQVGGELRLQAAQLALAPRTKGEATLTWMNARAAGLALESFGSYQAQLQLDGNHAVGDVTTLQGPLMLEGRVEFDQQPRVDMLASSDEPQVAGWLKTLGLPAGDGRYRLRMP